jgi:tRNA(adenine34) deaminase
VPHTRFMEIALKEAEKAAKLGEIPVGAVIVQNNEIIARAHNQNRALHNPTRHAEIIAIERASEKLSNERLLECDLYVTKEPCTMCAGALIHARIRSVYVGCHDLKYGACGTVFNICGSEAYNHQPIITFGILEEAASLLIKNFFKKLREKK